MGRRRPRGCRATEKRNEFPSPHGPCPQAEAGTLAYRMGAFESQQNGTLDFRDGSLTDIEASCRNVRFTPETGYRLVASRHLTNNAIERHSAPRSTRARQTKPCMNQHKAQSLCTKRVVTAFQIVRSQQGSVWIPHSGFSYTPCSVVWPTPFAATTVQLRSDISEELDRSPKNILLPTLRSARPSNSYSESATGGWRHRWPNGMKGKDTCSN